MFRSQFFFWMCCHPEWQRWIYINKLNEVFICILSSQLLPNWVDIWFECMHLILLTYFSLAVILPTIWRYLQTLDAAPYFLGLGLSAFSLSGLLSGPLFGHWSDRTKTTKKIILFANVFEIVGESVLWLHSFFFHSLYCCLEIGLEFMFIRFTPIISCTNILNFSCPFHLLFYLRFSNMYDIYNMMILLNQGREP